MRLVLTLLAIDALCLVHAAKTGRIGPWACIILAIPVLGAAAYLIFEVVPEWLGSAQGQIAQRRFAKRLDPSRRYKKLSAGLAAADTIANRVVLAQECLALGRFAEAKRHFDHVIAQPLGDEPSYMVGRARAEFGLGRPGRVVATLDKLREFWPDYESADAHLLYARALEASGRTAEAVDEYRALAGYFQGAEARVRWGLLLSRLGRAGEAQSLFSDVVTQMRRTPNYVRKVQAEWIAIAEKALRA
jgi:hypothetical protein